jgi:hypothetical protein
MIDPEKIKQALRNTNDEKLIPYYKTIYTADSVELEDTQPLLESTNINQQDCLTILSNSCLELKADFNNYLINDYKTLEYNKDRLNYIDIANIAHFIIWKFKFNETACFERIFNNTEVILTNGDRSTQELIVIGFFEGIQNIGGWSKVDYYKGFDQWLKPKSKKEWDNLIERWEGKK